MASLKFSNAIKRIPQNVPPIWFMRQAGRYHKHYQQLRKEHSFVDLCKRPELACEVALGPIEDFDFDVSIMFSDLLFPLEALGMGLEYSPGPKLDWRLNADTIKRFIAPDKAIEKLEFQKDVLKATRRVLPDDKSLIGFIGGAWTLFTYACEGGHDGNMVLSKSNLSLFPSFCEFLLPLLEANIKLQLEGGAEIVMIFDTSAGGLSHQLYCEVVIPTLVRLSESFPQKLGYYGKYLTNAQMRTLSLSAPHLIGLGFDHRWNLPEAMNLKTNGFVQGNFDQSLLFLSPIEFSKELGKYIETFKKMSIEERAGWVCGLGHGVLPETPEENVRTFVQTVRSEFYVK